MLTKGQMESMLTSGLLNCKGSIEKIQMKSLFWGGAQLISQGLFIRGHSGLVFLGTLDQCPNHTCNINHSNLGLSQTLEAYSVSWFETSLSVAKSSHHLRQTQKW